MILFVLLNAANRPLVKLWIAKADLDGEAFLYAEIRLCQSNFQLPYDFKIVRKKLAACAKEIAHEKA